MNTITGNSTKEEIRVLDNMTAITVTVNSTSVQPNTEYLYDVQAHNSIGFVTYGSASFCKFSILRKYSEIVGAIL